MRLFRLVIPVSDLTRAVSFYEKLVGSPGVRVSGGRHYFDCGGVILACVDPRADGDDYDSRPIPEWIYFAAPDLEAAWRACQQAGATPSPETIHDQPAGAIAVRPWGERSFYVLDPFGNKLCFVAQDTVFTGPPAR